jgi:predicted transposase YdaD
MRESVIYQEILQKGLQQGRQEGRQEGEVALVLRLLNRRFGAIAPDLQAQIQQLSITQLEELGESLLDFSVIADLTAWLEAHQSPEESS